MEVEEDMLLVELEDNVVSVFSLQLKEKLAVVECLQVTHHRATVVDIVNWDSSILFFFFQEDECIKTKTRILGSSLFSGSVM